MNHQAQFLLDEVLEHLKHYLPEQAPLKDFIHHNTLHSFQEFKFFEGTQRANEMFGTGSILYAQCAYLMNQNILKNGNRLMPYLSTTLARFDRLNHKNLMTMNIGLNLLLNGHKAKLTLDFQNRPNVMLTQQGNNETVTFGKRLNTATLQYQVFF